MFHSVLYQFRSLRNVGMLARNHEAFGGDKMILIGFDEGIEFKRGSEGFAKKIEEEGRMLRFSSWNEFEAWRATQEIGVLAVEVSEEAVDIRESKDFGQKAFVFGNERTGVPQEIIEACDGVVKIDQKGNVASLNVAVSAGIIFFEATRELEGRKIEQNKFV